MTANQQDTETASSIPESTTNDSDLNHWQPIPTFLDDNHQFSLGQIRWLIRNKANNGFDKCIKKVGRQYYINDQIFAQCITNQD